ncbi:hypothetical protein B0H13DRAFT_2277407 [Mycena leptocephala]|nr:hypothetical protein B0H13DRAFT_2277407 [Mycena leptocephala]
MYSDSSPIFPPELERKICEAAAYLHPETIPTLLLVAQRVREWIEGIRFETVTSTGTLSTCPIRVLKEVIQLNSKPASFFRGVRHLNLFFEGPEDIPEILSACSEIQHLAVVRYAVPLSTIPSLAALKPRRLSLYLKHFNSFDLRPMFTFVTHLDTLDSLPFLPNDNIAHWLSFMTLLPALTHLSLRRGFDMTRDVLARCKKLEVLVFMHTTPKARQHLVSVNDYRFVHMFLLLFWDRVHDWVTGANGGIDFWARAEAFIAKKRRGEIAPSSRCWIEEGDGIGVGYNFSM